MIALRPHQQTALALLGYKLWLPRAELAALRAAPPAPVATPETPAPTIPTTAPAAVARDATILPLPGITASVHLARDYTLLSGEALRCHWLLPPLWSEAGRLMPFASDAERRLLLALFHAIDCDEALQTAGSAFGKTTLKVYNFLHPYTVLSDMTQKNTLWRQWEKIKRSLF